MAENNETPSREIAESAVDELVYRSLPNDHYIPFADLKLKVNVASPEVRASLLRLQAVQLADLVYGRGWRKLRKVVPNVDERR